MRGPTPEDQLPILCHTIEALVRADGPDLTARGLAILLVAQTAPGPHTVRGMAAFLRLAKPTVSRTLDRLEDLGLMKRVADPSDGRSVLMVPTRAGTAYVAKLQRAAVDAARPSRSKD